MPDLAIDTSSYPKSVAPPNALDTLGKVQSIQSGALTIDKQKLDLINQRYEDMSRGLAGIATDPNFNEDKLRQFFTNQVKMQRMPAEMAAQTISSLPPTQGMKPAEASATLKQWVKEKLIHASTIHEAINNYAGTPAEKQDQASTYQGVQQSALQGGGFTPATRMPIQLPPTQPNVNNQPTLPNKEPNPNYLQPGVVGPAASSGVYPAQPQNNLPVASPAVPTPQSRPRGLPISGATGPTVNRGNEFDNRFDAAFPNKVVTGPPVGFELGQRQRQQELETATAKATALKPLEEAYNLAKEVDMTGIGSENLNKIRSGLFNAGLVKQDEKNPAVLYQMLNKNLAQFVDKNGSRSDADLAIKESSNANAKSQLQPALLHMVQKIIGREKIEMARPQAFEGNELQNYPKHSAGFPTSQDERA